MASIDELKNNNVSVSLSGVQQDPDEVSKPEVVAKSKTFIENNKSPKIQTTVNVNKTPPMPGDVININAVDDDEDGVEDLIPTIPEEELNQEEIAEEAVDQEENEVIDDESDLNDENDMEDWGDDEEDDTPSSESVVETSVEEENPVEEVEEDEEKKDESDSKKEKKPVKKKKVSASDIELEEDRVTSEFETEQNKEEDMENEDEEVFDSESVTDNEMAERDEELKKLQDLISSRMKTAAKSIDLSSFTVAKKPRVNIKNLDRSSELSVSKWVAWDKKSAIFMKQYLGSELELLRQITMELRNSEGSQAYQLIMRRYGIIYDHIASVKPASVESWLRTTTVYDIDDYFFASYISAFKDSNFMPVDCANSDCNETWLSEDLPIMDLVKFPDEEVKEKFTELYHSEPVPNNKGIYMTEIIPISNKIAIGFKQSSIYDEVEKLLVDQQFMERYIMTIDAMPYIDNIYNINYETNELEPIGYKEYAGNDTKTYKSKVRKYHTVLSTLTSDEYNIINSYRNEIVRMDQSKRPIYVIPEFTCPKCGTVKPEEETSAESLVFTRCQLAALTNTSVN